MSKNYQITSFYDGDNRFWDLEEDGMYKYRGSNTRFSLEYMSEALELNEGKDCKIHIVKRLSDGKLFKIGDKVQYRIGGGWIAHSISNIVDFELFGKYRILIVTNNGGDGKLVIRPDSGDPVKIITGYTAKELEYMHDGNEKAPSVEEAKGVVELLWDIFGGSINEKGYKVLDSHIGAIYGDSITLERAKEICERLKAKGFASTNIVLGIGSFTYQYNTRDTFGFAMKATYGEVIIGADEFGPKVEERAIFKDPITDDGTKKSKKGLLMVVDGLRNEGGVNKDSIGVVDQCTWKQEKKGLLETVFLNGELTKAQTLKEIRERLN